MAVAELSVVPIGTGSPSVSRYVIEALKVIKKSGLRYELSSMGTAVEGPPEKILILTRQVHESAFRLGAVRVITTLKIDERRDKPLSIIGKKKAVEKGMRRKS
jgi:uncharacterized protein (TIGR00106 family)